MSTFSRFYSNSVISDTPSWLRGGCGLERGGHDFEPAKYAVSKLGLGLKRRSPLRLRPISPLSPPPLRQLLLSIVMVIVILPLDW